jgi:hypothetical protein
MHKSNAELAPEVEVNGCAHHLHLDYSIREPGEGYVAPGTDAFCLKTGLKLATFISIPIIEITSGVEIYA